MLSYAKMFKRVRPAFNIKQKKTVPRLISPIHNRAVVSAVARSKYSSEGNKNYSYGFNRFLYSGAALGILSLFGAYEMYKKKYSSIAECCGIIGYIGEEGLAGKLVLDGLQILQYRGYDS